MKKIITAALAALTLTAAAANAEQELIASETFEGIPFDIYGDLSDISSSGARLMVPMTVVVRSLQMDIVAQYSCVTGEVADVTHIQTINVNTMAPVDSEGAFFAGFKEGAMGEMPTQEDKDAIIAACLIF